MAFVDAEPLEIIHQGPAGMTGISVAATEMVSADANGNRFANDGRTVFVVLNGQSGTLTVTVQMDAVIDGEVLPDKSYTVGAYKTIIIGPFPLICNQPNTDEIYITYSSATSVKVCPIRMVG